MNLQTQEQDTKLSAIDRALAAAKARKAAKDKQEVDASGAEQARPSREERALQRAQREEEFRKAREERRNRREQEKSEKKYRAPTGLPTHMKKVNNAKAKLPKMDATVSEAFNDLTRRFDVTQLTALSMHIQLHNREALTLKSTKSPPLKLGTTVRITGGDPKFVGLVGQVVHSQRLRARVKVPGLKYEVYVYSCEAEETQQATVAE